MSGFPFKSLQDWLDHLSANNDLVINENKVSTRGEIGAISRSICMNEAQAVVHTNVDGFPGWRVYSDGLTTRKRQAEALGLSADQHVLSAMTERMANAKPTDKKVTVDKSSAPCKQVILKGDDINLLDMPFPFTTEYESPPYITSGISFVRDPETGWTNSGIRRFQIKGERKLCILILPTQHEGMIFSKYLNKNERMPISIVVGADPLTYACTLFPAPPQYDEMDNWSLIAGQPLEMVKSETNEIMVPANAEMIIEGYVEPVEREFEGPFSEVIGYYSGTRYLPVIHVEAITMRKNPYLQYMYMGKSPSEGHRLMDLAYEIELYRQAKPIVPELTDVAVLSTHFLTGVISIDKEANKRTPGLAKKIGMAVKGMKAAHTIKNMFIVDDDISVQDIDDILWAMSVRFQPMNDITVIPLTGGFYLDPSEPSTAISGGGQGYTSLAFYDCTEKRAPYDEGYKRGVAVPAKKTEELVKKRWREYGFR